MFLSILFYSNGAFTLRIKVFKYYVFLFGNGKGWGFLTFF